MRAEASRLRTRLEQYYKTTGRADPFLLLLPKGNYVPQFTPRTSTPDPASAQPPDADARGFRFITNPWFAWFCVLGALALAAAAWIRVRPPGGNPQPLLQFEVELKSDGVLASDVGTQVVLSPNGTRVVFVSRTADGRTHLNTRRLDQPKVDPAARYRRRSWAICLARRPMGGILGRRQVEEDTNGRRVTRDPVRRDRPARCELGSR